MDIEATTYGRDEGLVATMIDGFEIVSEPDNEREPSPTRQVVAAMLNCTFIYLRAYLESMGFDVSDLAMSFKGHTKDDGTYDRMAVDVTLPKGVPAEKKATLKRVMETCTVKRIMHTLPEVSVTFL